MKDFSLAFLILLGLHLWYKGLFLAFLILLGLHLWYEGLFFGFFSEYGPSSLV
jgi:hypothetical protein